MNSARFLEPARREFLAEVAYYEEVEQGLGTRFAAAVEDATARAVAFPLAGGPASNNARRVFLKDFPFALVYRPEEIGIVIVALAHHSRFPEYWQPRVQERSSSDLMDAARCYASTFPNSVPGTMHGAMSGR